MISVHVHGCYYREDLAQIALFNMTVDHNTKYYDFYDELMPWINENWELMAPGKVCNRTPNMSVTCTSANSQISRILSYTHCAHRNCYELVTN